VNHKLVLAVAAGATIALMAAIQIQRRSSEGRESLAMPSLDTGSPVRTTTAVEAHALGTERGPGDIVTDHWPPRPPDAGRGGVLSASSHQGSPTRTPMPMSDDDIRRVSAFAERLAATSERQREFLTLAAKEEADPHWSQQMQEALAGSLGNHYGDKGGLEVSEVRCTRSICSLSAVVSNSSSLGQATDWQSLIGSVMGEPWFPQQFFDASTTMGADDDGMIYITYLVRKPPD
jgi:hypothetical protein